MIYRVFCMIIFLFSASLVSNVTVAAVVPAPPKAKATSYLVMDHHSGRMLVAENIDKRVEPASLTKMMTAYVAASDLAAGNISLDDMVVVSEKAWRMQGSRMFIEVNTEVSVNDLLKGIIIQSGNDASIALAEHIAGSEEVFVEIMNQHAEKLSMTGTKFMNATGLPDTNHYTTARDMATLAAALIRDHPDIYAWHAIREFTYNGITQQNRNSMLWRDEGVDGVKTGHTDSAGFSLVTSAKRGDTRLISVVMGSDGKKARLRVTQAIMNYSFRYYETHKLYSADEIITTRKVWKGNSEAIGLGVVDNLYITIPRGKYKLLDASIELGESIIAPVGKGDIQGSLRVILEGKELINKPLVALQSIDEGSIFVRFKDSIMLLFE